MDETNPIRQVLIQRVETCRGADFPIDNPHDSPITDLLNVSYEYGILELVYQCARGAVLSKSAWQNTIWEVA